MRYAFPSVLALLFVSTGPNALAQFRPESPPKIKFDDFNPMPGIGEIKAKGTYSLGDKPGSAVMSFTVECFPFGGGNLVSKDCKWKDGKWDGVISKLAAGKYNFHALMRVKDAKGKEITYSSEFCVENVR